MIGIISQLFSIIILSGISVSNKKTEERESVTFLSLLSDLKNILKQQHMRYLLLSVAVFQSAMSVLLNFSQIILTNKSFSPFSTSLLISTALAFSAISTLSIERISKKIGQNFAIGLFMILLFIGFLMLSFSNLIIVVVSFLIINFSFEFVDTSLNAVIQELSNDKIRTTLISSVNTLTAGMMLIETSIVSLLFSNFNISVVYVSIGIFLVLCTSILYIIFLKTTNYEEKSI